MKNLLVNMRIFSSISHLEKPVFSQSDCRIYSNCDLVIIIAIHNIAAFFYLITVMLQICESYSTKINA